MVTQLRPEPEADDSAFKAPNTLYEIAYRKWKQQWDDIDSIERKAFGLFGIASAALAVIFGIIRLQQTELRPIALWSLFAALALFAVASVLIGIAVWPRGYWSQPETKDVRFFAFNREEDEFRLWAGEMYLKAYDRNQSAVKIKVLGLQGAFICTGLEILALAAALLSTFTLFG